ncbi:hypothetical protein Slin15195_G052970 [Septoria linicola]|uniref:Uncharacterized protein n=1 Tax=Septoria linicola TaxID=215465 RepID=A0A9Q9EK29_9PEZI|nr:hypothetical protein Slin14017_G123760 [Septoria linicola]USW51978.1 hypothetical protein Slin15195_G052970 [Septoria linicola]
MATTADSITNALAPSRQAFFHSIWQDHWPKLNLTSASKVFTFDVELAETLLSWLKDSHYDLPYSITIPSNPAEKVIDPTLAKIANIHVLDRGSAPEDDSITHALAYIGLFRTDDDSVSSTSKRIFYSLIPKGVAIVSVTKYNPIDSILRSVLSISGGRRPSSAFSGLTETVTPAAGTATDLDLRNLAEKAGFELGKVRVSERSILVGGDELRRLRSEVLRILDAAKGQQGDAQSWESGFDEAWEREIRDRGEGRGLRVECWVLVAMKWDLLCA